MGGHRDVTGAQRVQVQGTATFLPPAILQLGDEPAHWDVCFFFFAPLSSLCDTKPLLISTTSPFNPRLTGVFP